jgi:hypothetical protein
MDNITIEARKRLQQEASHYVRSVVVHYMYTSLVRWNTPVCPLVAGLPKDRGEFILWRISQVASAAHVPLAGEHCNANMFVIVTPVPDELLERWWRKNPRLYDTHSGMGHVNDFLHDKHPIRSWYNASFTDAAGAPVTSDSVLASLGGGMGTSIFMGVPESREYRATRLQYNAVQSLSSVIIMVDERRIADFNLAQVGDYVALLGLAEIQPDAALGDTPSILRLFRHPDSLPPGLSAWDEALLYGLYNTGQQNVMQASSIVVKMTDRIGAAGEQGR